jgi:hypothetical protein
MVVQPTVMQPKVMRPMVVRPSCGHLRQRVAQQCADLTTERLIFSRLYEGFMVVLKTPSLVW